MLTTKLKYKPDVVNILASRMSNISWCEKAIWKLKTKSTSYQTRKYNVFLAKLETSSSSGNGVLSSKQRCSRCFLWCKWAPDISQSLIRIETVFINVINTNYIICKADTSNWVKDALSSLNQLIFIFN